MDRRGFLRSATMTGAAAGLGPLGVPPVRLPPGLQDLPRTGPKPVARGKKAVASSSHAIVTDTMLAIMKAGGNAVDAGIAGCLVQAVVQPEMTNHAGTVTFLYWEAKTGKSYQHNSSGTL